MRNKRFYDCVHYLDILHASARDDEEYMNAIEKDNTRNFFMNFYDKTVLYRLVQFYFQGVTRAEIEESIAFIHGVNDGSKIRAAIVRQVKDEIASIYRQAKEDEYKNIVAYIEKRGS